MLVNGRSYGMNQKQDDRGIISVLINIDDILVICGTYDE